MTQQPRPRPQKGVALLVPRCLTLVLFQLFVASYAFGQEPTRFDPALGQDLEKSLTELEDAYLQAFADLSAHIPQEIAREIAGLRRGSYGHLTEDYVESLQGHIKLLEESRSLPPSLRLAVLKEIAHDLEIKRRFFDFHETDYRPVVVEAITVDADHIEHDGFTVHCIASGYHVVYTHRKLPLKEITSKIETRTLKELSSPTRIAVPPGVYVWWTARGGKFGEPRRFEIGDEPGRKRRGDKAQPIVIQLYVPERTP